MDSRFINYEVICRPIFDLFRYHPTQAPKTSLRAYKCPLRGYLILVCLNIYSTSDY